MLIAHHLGFSECTECTFADWVGLEDPNEADSLTEFIVEFVDFTLVDPTVNG
jgi:hypothetical protein